MNINNLFTYDIFSCQYSGSGSQQQRQYNNQQQYNQQQRGGGGGRRQYHTGTAGGPGGGGNPFGDFSYFANMFNSHPGMGNMGGGGSASTFPGAQQQQQKQQPRNLFDGTNDITHWSRTTLLPDDFESNVWYVSSTSTLHYNTYIQNTTDQLLCTIT